MSEAERFKAFEAAGWSERAATYERLTARATAFAIEPLLDAARVRAGVRLLEVASGLGALAAAAAARGAEVTGVDLADGMVAAARRRHPEIEFVRGDVEALPFADGAFDAVAAAFVVNHLPEPERGAAEMVRVLRPGGRLALAMWGPPDEVAILGLPAAAAAAAGLDPGGVPPGPSSLRFTDPGELAGLLDGLSDVTVRDHRFMLHVRDLDELWAGILGGTVRTAARLTAATPGDRDLVRDALGRLAERHRGPAGYQLPTTIRVAAARR